MVYVRKTEPTPEANYKLFAEGMAALEEEYLASLPPDKRREVIALRKANAAIAQFEATRRKLGTGSVDM